MDRYKTKVKMSAEAKYAEFLEYGTIGEVRYNLNKSEIELMAELEGNDAFNLEIRIVPYSKRGYELITTWNNKGQREFVGYSENIGEFVDKLINKYIQDEAIKKEKAEQIERIKEEISDLEKELDKLG